MTGNYVHGFYNHYRLKCIRKIRANLHFWGQEIDTNMPLLVMLNERIVIKGYMCVYVWV